MEKRLKNKRGMKNVCTFNLRMRGGRMQFDKNVEFVHNQFKKYKSDFYDTLFIKKIPNLWKIGLGGMI